MIRCLIIDDNSFDRKVLRRAAEGCKLQISFREAFDIRSAENILEAEDFDCIMLDFRLPDGDGLSFAKRFIAASENKLPLIMITGRGNESIAREAFHLGILDYVTKESLTSENLERVVRHALAKTQSQRAEQTFMGVIVEDALRQFASYLARDLMAPIGTIRTSCQAICANPDRALDEETRKLLKNIEEAADRASKLIESSLAYADPGGAGERRLNALPMPDDTTMQ
jgi:CheY-like chemotaxis protein